MIASVIFFIINLSLINGEAVLLYHNRPTSLLNWMIRKQSTDPVFDQISVRLSDTAHLIMKQKYIFFKKTLIYDGLSMLLSYAAFTF